VDSKEVLHRDRLVLVVLMVELVHPHRGKPLVRQEMVLVLAVVVHPQMAGK
jgi:hypothetical protein